MYLARILHVYSFLLDKVMEKTWMSVFVLFTISSGKYKKEHTNWDSVDHINENLVPWHILSCNVNYGHWQNMKMLIFESDWSLIFILPLVCENVYKFVFQVIVTYVACCCIILFIMQGSHFSCWFVKMKGVIIY